MDVGGPARIPSWPGSRAELEEAQRELALIAPPNPWHPGRHFRAGGVFVAAPRGLSGSGVAGDIGWAAAVTMEGSTVLASAEVKGQLGAPYEPGFLALRQGPLLEAAVRALQVTPDLLLVNATGLDHPRRAGLALHLGAILDLPTIGVTDRPLLPEADRLGLARAIVTSAGGRPIWIHPGWRMDLVTAVGLATALARGRRTPDPLREARRLARTARAREVARE